MTCTMHKLDRARGKKTKAAIFAAAWTDEKTCANCNTRICRHVHRSLRGCMLQEGHEGEHFNPWSTDNFRWGNDDGRFVRLGNRDDWVALVNGLGKRHTS